MNKMQKIVIAGIGENAALAYEFFTYDSEFEVIAFCVNEAYRKVTEFCDCPVVSIEEVENKYPPEEFYMFVALGSGQLNRNRTKVYKELKEKKYQMASYISSRALVWRNVVIGDNCFVLGNVVLQPFSKIGNNVTLWYNSNVGHRSIIRDNSFIASASIASFSEIGENSFVGAGAVIANNIVVACDNYIAMGTQINKSTRENSMYKGNPAVMMNISAKLFCNVEED